MEELEMPLYSNTCGKLFADRIVFASAHKETVYLAHNLRTITFSKRMASQSLFLMLVPAALFVIPYYVDVTVTVQAAIIFMIFLLVIFSYIKARRRYAIHIYRKEGRASTIRVWEGNRRDAENFVKQARTRFFTA